MRTTFHDILVIELKKLTKCSQIIMTNTSHIFVTINSHIWRAALNREPENILGTRHWERMPIDMIVVIFQNLTCPLWLGWWLKWVVVIRSFMPLFSHKTQSYFACFPSSDLSRWEHGTWDLGLHIGSQVLRPMYDTDEYMATLLKDEAWDLCSELGWAKSQT